MAIKLDWKYAKYGPRQSVDLGHGLNISISSRMSDGTWFAVVNHIRLTKRFDTAIEAKSVAEAVLQEAITHWREQL